MKKYPLSRLCRCLGVAALAAGLLGTAQTVSAEHQWSSYHWEKKNTTVLTLAIGNNHDGPTWPTLFYDVVDGWVAYGGAYFSTTAVAGGQGDVESYNDNYGDTGWLGLASISVKRGKNKHITSGISKVNDYYSTLVGYDGFNEIVEWQHVLCQEIGHTFGLDHNRNGATGGEPDDSCMNDEQRPLRYPTPNIHDTEQLDLMYAEDHGSDDGGGGGPKKCHPRFGCPSVAHALWAERYASEPEMFAASDLVVDAEVVSSRFDRMVGRPDRAVPITRVVLRVTEARKGAARPVIVLEQTRGSGLEIASDPGYVQGDRYTLYLRDLGGNTYRTVNPVGRIKR